MNIFRSKEEMRNVVREADVARDSRLWQKAADFYDEHLQANPEDTGIWVQAGNCLKEAGVYREAAKRYQKALELSPDDSDIHLQRGHLLKVMGRTGEAIESYKRSVECNPGNRDAVIELVAAGAAGDVFSDFSAEAEKAVKTIWLDVTDLMEYAQHNKSLSGIQRVVANLVLHIESGIFKDYRVIPVIPEYDRHRILAASPAALATLVRQFDVPIVDRSMVDKAIAAVFDARFEVWPTQDDIFVVAGAFWIYPHYDIMRKLREKGMRFCVFVHDLIQIRNPEYVQQAAVDKFQRQLIDVFSVCDFVLANSQFVASEIRAYFKERLNFELPVKAIPLATELRKTQKKARILNTNILGMAEEEYVLCVATIEVRKNHMYQIRIWERLIRELGDKAPKLVWVGKWGWQIDELRHHLAIHGYVGDWLYIFNDISDDELEYLYRHSLFTTYTSFAEGFGLPIGESLNYSKPCIASNATSMPEVGGHFVRYINPYNVEDGYNLFKQVIVDRNDLADWQRDIKENFVPKSWDSFCSELFSTAIDMSVGLGDQPGVLNCRLPRNTIIEGGDTALLRIAAEGRRILTFRAARDSGWFAMEDWGVWASQRRSRLVFDSELAEGESVRIYLEVRCPALSENIIVTTDAGGETCSFQLVERPTYISFGGIVGPHGRVTVNLLTRGRFGDTGDRSCHLGLSAVAYCDGADPLERVGLLEKVMLQSQLGQN